MIINLKLTNFKQHVNREFTFGPGLQLIKGENEAGKSGVLQAISYALFGARALPLSLSETVTWGKPDSALRVELKFAHAGVEYSIYRQKSGAELRGGAIVASGHSEVTKFVEGLFGPSDVVNSLIIANQNRLKGTMVARPGDSTGLIEKLARFDLLDGIVTSIQSNFPTGSPNALQALLANESAMQEPVPPDMSEVLLAEQVELGKLGALESELAAITASRDGLPVSDAKKTLQEAEFCRNGLKKDENLLAQSEFRISCITVPDAPTPQEYADLDTEEMDYLADLNAYNSYNSYMSAVAEIAKLKGAVWEGTMDGLKAHQSHIALQSKDLQTRIADTNKEIGLRQGALIKAGECSFCGKLLDDVPEVQSLNARLTAEIADLQQTLEDCKSTVMALTTESAQLRAIEQVALAVEKLCLSKALVESSAQTPPKLVWPFAVPNKLKPKNFAAKRKELQDRALASTKALTERSNLQGQLTSLKAAIVALQDRLASLDTVAAEETLSKFDGYEEIIRSMTASVQKKKAEVAELKRAKEAKIDAYRREVALFSQSLARREEYKKAIAEMDLNNGVIKKIREVRPEVAARLWRMVLSTVNHYFSKVRGAASVVTRGESGFLVDGRPAEGLSGSAQDALGLAERIALTKTFMPNTGFLVLDEPAAAASDARESNMLATLAGAGFDQVIMVSHSNLADAFAAAIVEI